MNVYLEFERKERISYTPDVGADLNVLDNKEFLDNDEGLFSLIEFGDDIVVSQLRPSVFTTPNVDPQYIECELVDTLLDKEYMEFREEPLDNRQKTKSISIIPILSIN